MRRSSAIAAMAAAALAGLSTAEPTIYEHVPRRIEPRRRPQTIRHEWYKRCEHYSPADIRRLAVERGVGRPVRR